MNIISIGTDRNIWKEGSAVRVRQVSYGEMFTSLHLIVYTTRSHGLPAFKLSHNVHVYPTNSLSKVFYVRDAAKIAAKIGKELNGRKVITTQDPFETGLAGARVAQKLGIPLHVQIHTDFLSPYFKSSSILNRIRTMVAKKIIPKATRLRVVSERIKNALVAHKFPVRVSKIDILPIYTDIQKIESASASDSLRKKYPQFNRLILMASRLSHEKDIPTALRAFKMHSEAHPHSGLVIVGSGPESEKIKRISKRLGIEEKVKCEEWISQETLYSYYKTADIFLSTSLFEGYGLTLLEAAVSKLPLVSTDVGIAPELLQGPLKVQLCPPKDAVCISRALNHIVESYDRAKTEAAHLKTTIKVRTNSEYMREYKNSLWMCTE